MRHDPEGCAGDAARSSVCPTRVRRLQTDAGRGREEESEKAVRSVRLRPDVTIRKRRVNGSRPVAAPERGTLLIETDAVVQRVAPDRLVVAVGRHELPRQD